MVPVDKDPDRINISSKTRELVGKIDKHKLFGLHSSATSRSELYLLALAFGLSGSPLPLTNVHQDGFVLDKSIDGLTLSLMTALSIYHAETENLDELDKATSKREIYYLADGYANTGFALIADLVENCRDDESYILKMISQLDDLAEELGVIQKD